MAITVLQSPDQIMPVYNDIVFTVDSTNKAQCSFRYVCDIYVNGLFIIRLKLFPYGTNGYASFKVDRVLQDFVTYDLHNNLYGTNIFSRNNETLKDYQLKFGEEYDNSAQCDAGTTVYPNLTNTTTFSFFNSSFQYKNWLSYSSSTYKMVGPTNKFLSNIPNGAYINMGDQMTFNFLQSGFVDRLEVKTYNNVGSLIGTYTYDNNFSTVSLYTDKILTVGIGPENLNNSTLASGVQPVIHSNVFTYTIQLIDLSGNPVSELKSFTMDKRVTAFTQHRIWWLNRLGGFDSYDYSQKDYRKVNTTRTEFTRLLGEYRTGSPSNKWTYDIGDRGRTVISVDAQETDRYNSNWMTQNESLWMEELFTSPEVYMSDQNIRNCFQQVRVVNNGGGGEGEPELIQTEIPFNNRFYTPPEIGDMIFVDFGEDALLSELNGPQEVLNISETHITIVGPGGGGIGLIPVIGFILPYGFISQLDPVIIKTSSYDEKIKYRVKNIQYEIEVDKAYGINTQRN